MGRKDPKLSISAFLAILFTLALTFATLELPRAISHLLSHYFPDFGFELGAVEEFMRTARPIGYMCLIAVIVLMIIGFMTGRGRLSALGSIAFFLPTFGYFAFSMFFLAGIGILRGLWVPFWDLSPNLLKLGDIVYLPFMIMVYPFNLVGMNVKMPLVLLAIGSGLLVFFLGTFAWLFGRFERKEIIDFWIYKHSRHPQYLGFLLWSYGIMLLATFSPFPRGGYIPGPSLPWLISALVLICVALMEEIKMTKRHHEKYLKYQSSTPFMLPLPKFISATIAAPIRALIKTNFPKSEKEVLCTFAVYSAISILLSLPFLILNWPPGYGWSGWP